MNFVKIGDKKRCSGSSIENGLLETVEACALGCHGVSSLFRYGTTEWKNSFICNDYPVKCYCDCETSADGDGKCDLVDDLSYNIYKYN